MNRKKIRILYRGGRLFLLLIAMLAYFSGCARFSRPSSDEAPPGAGPETSAEREQNGRPSEEGEDGAARRRGRPREPEREIFAVSVTPAYKGELINYLLVSGDVVVQSRVSMVADVAGDITDVYVKIGKKVRRNQILLKIDPSKPGQSFEPRLVRSTISGTVVALPVEIGSRTNVGTRVVDVAKTTELEINVDIAERFVSVVDIGSRAIVEFDAFPGERFEALVSTVNPVLDPSNRTLETTLSFRKSYPQLKAGMFALAKLITEEKTDVVQIPTDCVIYRFGKSYVYVIEDDIAYEREILTGIEIDNRIEILEGIAEDDLVVYQGQSLLNDETKVRIIQTLDVIATEQVF